MTDVGELRIMIAAPRDLPEIVTLMGHAFDPRFGEAWSGSQLIGALAVPDTWVQVAKATDAVVGFTLVRRILDEAELMLVAVTPDRRATGFGRQLLDCAMSQAMFRGARTMFLEVRDGNVAASFLYRAAGFDEIGRRRDYYSGPDGQKFDAITLRRSLID